MKKVKTYIKDRFDNYSLMNLNIKTYLTENDYTEFEITDRYKYKIDSIARDLLGDTDLYFFIIWINPIYSYEDLDEGITIKIPTLDFIKRVKKDLEIFRGKIK